MTDSAEQQPTRYIPPLTKILATLGPASDDPKVIRKMIEHGATLFRLNFSHGSFDAHARRLEMVRSIGAELDETVGVLGDLSGPKIRVGQVPGDGVMLEAGQDVEIRTDIEESRPGTPPVLSCTYPALVGEVAPGDRVLINDGVIRMLAVEQLDHALLCRVMVGGLVTTGKGINLPDSDLSVPAITEKDWKCVEWAFEHDIDFLALSFVRKADEVIELQQALQEMEERETGLRRHALAEAEGGAARIPVIAKIETPQAVRNMESIIDAADGIMVARGDLGVEMDVAKVPVIQKQLVNQAHAFGKPCIVATQMLESMIHNAIATRAEVSDVANAILDRVDAVMLSGETAVGHNPVLAVETMRRVALATEESIREDSQEPRPPARLRELRHRTPALAHGAWHVARDIGARCIGVWSQLGGEARYLSRNGFNVPIIAFSSNLLAVRRMTLLYGVFPIYVEHPPEHRSEFALIAEKAILSHHLAVAGDPVVHLGGKPLDRPGGVNTLAIRYVGEMNGQVDEHGRARPLEAVAGES
ncbi:MAG: pyruvate kinase [Phycisphaerales bacterium]